VRFQQLLIGQQLLRLAVGDDAALVMEVPS
jgi:hypothetical protein